MYVIIGTRHYDSYSLAPLTSRLKILDRSNGVVVQVGYWKQSITAHGYEHFRSLHSKTLDFRAALSISSYVAAVTFFSVKDGQPLSRVFVAVCLFLPIGNLCNRALALLSDVSTTPQHKR